MGAFPATRLLVFVHKHTKTQTETHKNGFAYFRSIPAKHNIRKDKTCGVKVVFSHQNLRFRHLLPTSRSKSIIFISTCHMETVYGKVHFPPRETSPLSRNFSSGPSPLFVRSSEAVFPDPAIYHATRNVFYFFSW